MKKNMLPQMAEEKTEPKGHWERFRDWLGLNDERPLPPDLLETDPARHFMEWDRDMPRWAP